MKILKFAQLANMVVLLIEQREGKFEVVEFYSHSVLQGGAMVELVHGQDESEHDNLKTAERTFKAVVEDIESNM